MNLVDIGNIAHDIDGFQRSEVQVVVPGQILRLGNCAAPRNQEDLMALGDSIFDERISGAEIEQIVFVDAGRDDQERRLLDLGRLRRILNKLDQFVLEYDRSRGNRKIATDLEGGFIHPRDAPFLKILDQVLHAGRQARRARLNGGPNDLRIGRRKVRRAHRVDKLSRIETKLQLGSVVDLRLIDKIRQLLRVRQIGLLEKIVVRRVAPGLVLEASIASRCSRRRIRICRRFAAEESSPEIQNRRPIHLLQVGCDRNRRLLRTLCRLADDTHCRGERIVELFGCLLSGPHQAFKIDGGTVLRGRASHVNLP